MHVGHLNIRGIRSGEKMDQIKIMLHSNENDISMLGVSESKLGMDVPDSFIEIDNFQCFRKDKMQGSCGLLVYVRDNISCSHRKDLEDEHFESTWAEIYPKNSKPLLIGHFYRKTLFQLLLGMKCVMTKWRRQLRKKKKYFYLGTLKKIY